MIYQFSAKNIFSIREQQTLDFAASPDKTYEDYAVVKIKNFRISKIGIVYGPNASGKTNILLSLTWLINLLTTNNKSNVDKGTELTPFLMDQNSREEHSELSLIFFIEMVRYDYFIELDRVRIYRESLSYYPNGRKTAVFERKWKEDKKHSIITFGTALGLTPIQKLFIESNCVANATVLSTYIYSNVERNELLDGLRNYFRITIMPFLTSHVDIEDYASARMKDNMDCKQFMREMLGKADFNISDFYIKEEKSELSEEQIEQLKTLAKLTRMPEPTDLMISKEELFFTHQTSEYTGDLENGSESDGTMRMYGLAAVLYQLVRYNHLLICDELEASLHYDLFVHFIKTFLVNSVRGQLIFCTHNLMLLDEEFIRRDMIYFANKNASGATEIYRAKEFGLHKDVSVLNAYRAGKLGAKPELGSIYLDL